MPLAPLNFTATAQQNDTVLLTWTKPADATITGHNIFKNAVWIDWVDGNTTSYTAAVPEFDKTVTYGIHSHDAASVTSPTVTATVFIDKLPATPTGFAATIEGSDVVLTWAANSEPDLNGYNVYVNDVWKMWVGKAVTTYRIVNVATNVDVKVGIMAVDNQNKMSPQVSSIIHIDTIAPAMPTGFAASISGSDVVLSWTKNPELDLGGYNLFINGDYHTTFTASDAAYTYLNAPTDQELLFELSAFDTKANESGHAASTIYIDTISPITPTGFAATVSGSDVVLSWAANSEIDLEGYKLYLDAMPVITLAPDVLTYTYLNAPTDQELFFELTAFDAGENESPRAVAIAYIDTIPDPDPPPEVEIETKPFSRTTPIRIYDKNEKLRLILDPRGEIPYFDGWFTEQLNGAITLEFTIPASHPRASYIENDGRAVIRDQDGNLIEFIIRIPEDSHDENGATKKVFAEGGDYELIDEWLGGYEATSVDLRTALEAVLSNTRWDVGDVEDFERQNVKIEPTTVKNAVHQLINIFGGERRFRVTENANIIDQRFIDVYKRRGEKKGKRFEFGKDASSIRRTIDSTGIKTALFGYGASGENDAPRLTFAGIEWVKANGDPVDKPLGQTWIGDPEALQLWGYGQGSRHRFGVYSGQEKDSGELLINTWRALQATNKAIRTYEFKAILLEKLEGLQHEKVRLGDVVIGIDQEISPPIRFEASIIEIKQNLNDDHFDEITVGNFRSLLDTAGMAQNAQEVLESNRGKWDEKATPEDAAAVARNEVELALAEAEARIAAAELKVAEAEADITATIGRIDAAEGDIEGLYIDLSTANGRIDAAVLDVADAQTDIATAQQSVANISARVDAAEGHLSDVDADLVAAQTNIGNAQALIDSVTGTDINGLTVLEGTLVTNKIVAENAVLSGTLTGSNAIIIGLETDNMIARNAVIQDATISGTIGANAAIISSATIQNAVVSGTLDANAATFLAGTFDAATITDALIQNATISGSIGANAATFINATMQDAIVTGSLDANAATFLSGTFQAATIIDATIQNATISGTLDSVSGTFTGELIGSTISGSTFKSNVVNNGITEIWGATVGLYDGSRFNRLGNEKIYFGIGDYESPYAYTVMSLGMDINGDAEIYIPEGKTLKITNDIDVAGKITADYLSVDLSSNFYGAISAYQKLTAKNDLIVEGVFAPRGGVEGISWTTFSLLNGWIRYSTGDAIPSYRKDHFENVRLRGSVKGGTANSQICTLPAGYRPSYTKRFIVNVGGSADFGQVTITTAGAVSVWGSTGASTFVGLDGIEFLAGS